MFNKSKQEDELKQKHQHRYNFLEAYHYIMQLYAYNQELLDLVPIPGTKITFEITDFGGLQEILDDLTIQTPVTEFFCLLPTEIQCLAIAYGCDDEEFQDEVYDFILDEDYDE